MNKTNTPTFLLAVLLLAFMGCGGEGNDERGSSSDTASSLDRETAVSDATSERDETESGDAFGDCSEFELNTRSRAESRLENMLSDSDRADLEDGACPTFASMNLLRPTLARGCDLVESDGMIPPPEDRPERPRRPGPDGCLDEDLYVEVQYRRTCLLNHLEDAGIEKYYGLDEWLSQPLGSYYYLRFESESSCSAFHILELLIELDRHPTINRVHISLAPDVAVTPPQ